MSTTTPATSINGDFFKSTFSNDGPSCVEVKFETGHVLIRDSKQNAAFAGTPEAQPVIIFPAQYWAEVLDLALASKSGRVDTLSLTLRSDEGADLTGLTSTNKPVTLTYTRDEWDAFIKGVADGQFDIT